MNISRVARFRCLFSLFLLRSHNCLRIFSTCFERRSIQKQKIEILLNSRKTPDPFKTMRSCRHRDTVPEMQNHSCGPRLCRRQCRFPVSAFRKNLSKKLKKAYKKYLPVNGRFRHWMGHVVMANLLELLHAVPFSKLGEFKHGRNFRLYRNLQNL